jgi:hypothetical protein
MSTVARKRKQRGIRRTPERAASEPRGPARQPGTVNRPAPLRLERQVMRVVAIAGTVGIGVGVAAIMGSQGSDAWLIGLVVSVLTLLLAMIVRWASRRLELGTRLDEAVETRGHAAGENAGKPARTRDMRALRRERSSPRQ